MWTSRSRLVVAMAALALSVCRPALAETQRLAQLWGGDRWLASAGIDWSLVYTSEVTAKVTGGGARTGANYRGDASLRLALDTERAHWWHGGSFVMLAQAQHGSTASERVGDFTCLSNLAGSDFVQLAQWYYRHDFHSGHWLKIGKQDANDDFGGSNYTSVCLNGSATYQPLIPLPSSPNQGWGIAANLQLCPHAGVNLGAFRDKFGHQPIYFAQPHVSYTVNGLPGTVRPGWWWNTNNVASIDTVTPTVYGGSYGYYVTWDQRVTPVVADDPRGVGLFGHFAWAPRDRSTARTGWSAGIEWTGPLPSRPDDRFALAIYQLGFGREAALTYSTETAIEALYGAKAMPWLTAKVGAQYLIHPGGVGADALVLGTRVETTF